LFRDLISLVRDCDISLQEHSTAAKLRTEKTQMRVGRQPKQELIAQSEQLVAFIDDRNAPIGGSR
jgi:hypothetical protein